ncbi:MAG: asparagine synthase-related protein [Cyanobacteriota bacterium]
MKSERSGSVVNPLDSQSRLENENQEIRVQIYGYCDKRKNEIEDMFIKKRTDLLIELGGEYTLVCESLNEVVIITSRIGAIHYFYYYDGYRFIHGQHVLEIVRDAGIDWDWNWESLGDLCELENLTENRTLHPHISRVPAGSIVRFDGNLTIRSQKLLDSLKITETNAVDAVNVFNSETIKWISDNPYLSLSGGFDSRAILSSMLTQSIYPTLVTLGNEKSSDVKVASQIAKAFCLKHILVELSVDDLLESGQRISFVTNGSKPACHWHTYLYPKKALVPKDQSFFVGTLGEFARSYYFDKGFLSLISEGFPNIMQEKFWMLKLSRHRTFKDSELTSLCDQLRSQINKNGTVKRARRNARLASGEFLAGGTKYYLEQRVPNFYANGIRMYNETGQWRSPFHNLEWLRIIWSLSDNWKLGSNWHRLAIRRNYPRLLGFPEEKGLSRRRMLSKAPPLYWAPPAQRMKYDTYDLSKTWYCNDQIQSFILDNHRELDSLIDRELTEEILKEHKRDQTRTKAISFILTILYFKKAIGCETRI